MRNIFKSVNIDHSFHLYPLPVIKENKYLIDINSNNSSVLDFFIKCFKYKYLSSPEAGFNSYYKNKKIHIDGKTQVFSFDQTKIMFNFLEIPTDQDKTKVEKINEILSEKVKAVLYRDKSLYSELSKRFEMQKKCKTCQKYGIDSEKINEILSILKRI